MTISWTAKKQITFFLIFLIIVISVGVFLFLRINAQTCGDGRQNQGEKGIDCGGPCAKQCLGEIRDLIVIWTKPLKISEGKYDVVAVAENRNLNLHSFLVKYNFKLYDERNILIASREGKTFVNPGQKFAVFEPNIDTGVREPARAYLEFDKNINWELAEGNLPELIVSSKNYDDSRNPTLTAVLSNKSIRNALNVEAIAVIYDSDGNALAASATVLDGIRGGSSADIFFTWPEIFDGEYDSDEIFVRTERYSDY